jgi:hypothetical protein
MSSDGGALVGVKAFGKEKHGLHAAIEAGMMNRRTHTLATGEEHIRI